MNGIHTNCWGLVVLGLLAGCGKASQSATITGEVTFNGLPARAEVTFQPIEPTKKPSSAAAAETEMKPIGRPAIGYTDARGRFNVKQSDEQPGTRPGDHEVRIDVFRSIRDDESPRSYGDVVTPVKQVRLQRTVEPGKNHFHFALTY